MPTIQSVDPHNGSKPTSYTYVDGENNAGFHTQEQGNGGDTQGMDTTFARTLNPKFLNDPISKKIVQMHFDNSPLTNITRQIRTEIMKSYEYYFASIDEAKVSSETTEAVTLNPENLSRERPDTFALKCPDKKILLNKSDAIKFKGILGYTPTGKTGDKYVELLGRICGRDSNNTYSVQIINGSGENVDPTYNITIPQGTKFFRVGSMMSEGAADTDARGSLPKTTKQYMEKFMTKLSVTTDYLNTDKNIYWSMEQMAAEQMRAFEEEHEAAYIFGNMGKIYDDTNKEYVYSTSGAFEQIREGGGKLISLNPHVLDLKTVINMVAQIFNGNSGSNIRYMFMGSDYASVFWGLKDVQVQSSVADANRCFGYNFRKIDISGKEIYCITHGLFDKLGYSNTALVLDLDNVSRCVFRPMEQFKKDGREDGTFDGKSIRLIESSSLCLKYPLSHAILEIDPSMAQNTPLKWSIL